MSFLINLYMFFCSELILICLTPPDITIETLFKSFSELAISSPNANSSNNRNL